MVATYQQHEYSPYLDGLEDATRSVVDQCGGLLQEALGRFCPKYQDSLGVVASRNKVERIYKKIEWCGREKDRLRVLRERMQDSIQRLSLLSGLAAR